MTRHDPQILAGLLLSTRAGRARRRLRARRPSPQPGAGAAARAGDRGLRARAPRCRAPTSSSAAPACRDNVRRTPQVISVLSSEDIARTGEGDIAGALARRSPASRVVGNGFVYVRGLGDRYSLALLNGSPLPSPEPLRRVVPLDIFPTSVIASALVQKSYSVNYPGEFGGGVINLTTPAVPREAFLDVGGSVTADVETSFQLGYSYYGGDLDLARRRRRHPRFPARAARRGRGRGTFNATSDAERRDFAASLSNAPTTLLQRMGDTPANFSGEVSSAPPPRSAAAGSACIASIGYYNGWRTRDALQQTSLDPGLGGTPQTSFETVTTDNRVVLSGLLGLGAEFGRHRIRWTNLFIRDTLKQSRLAAGFNRSVADQDPNLPPSIIEQNTYWFERQLIDTQLVGEFRFGNFSVDLRGTYATTRRKSPYERAISYFYLGDGNPATSGTGDVDDYVNNLASGGQFANIAFSASRRTSMPAGSISPTGSARRCRSRSRPATPTPGPTAAPRATSSNISGPKARCRWRWRRSGRISCSPISTSTPTTSSCATCRAPRAPPPMTPISTVHAGYAQAEVEPDRRRARHVGRALRGRDGERPADRQRAGADQSRQ